MLRKLAVVMSLASTLAFSEGTTSTIHVGVRGMVCGFCAVGLKKTFLAQKGVTKVDVSLEKKEIVLTLEPDATLDDLVITSRVKDAGYEVTRIVR
jgi:periplasmic mercuric ion binding protein